MFSFRSILLAAAAFATLTSAIPAPQLPNVAGASNIANVVGGIVPGNPLNGVGAPVKRGPLSFGDHFSDCHDKIELIVIEIGK